MNSSTPPTVFSAPGPGGWRRLADHFPRALTAEYLRIYAETCPPGMASYMERYGVLARTLDVAVVQGHLYITPVPLAGPRSRDDHRRVSSCGCCRECIRRFGDATRPPVRHCRIDRGAPSPSTGSPSSATSGGTATARSRMSTLPISTTQHSPTISVAAASTSPAATSVTSSCTATIYFPSGCWSPDAANGASTRHSRPVRWPAHRRHHTPPRCPDGCSSPATTSTA